MPPANLSLSDRFAEAQTFTEFLHSAEKLVPFWEGMWQRATVEEAHVERARALGGSWNLLLLNADWCGDSVNTVPYIARLAEATPRLEMRLLDRDAHADLMQLHLTGGAKAIPKVLVLDDRFELCATWGPRPAELQRWVRQHGRALPRDQRYKELRAWYARDRGRTTVEEILTLLEDCTSTRQGLTSGAGG